MARQSTQRLIQLVCEERATADQCADLERQALADPAVLRAYVDAMNVHAALVWDQAEREPPVSRTVLAADRRPAWPKVVAIGALAATVTIIAVVWQTAPPKADGRAEAALAAKPVELPAENPTGQPLAVADAPPPAADQTPVPIVPEPVATPVVVESPAQRPAFDLKRIVASIDEAIAARWADEEVTPSAVADDGDWLRRASLDLRGRIPTAAEIDLFLADDPATRRDRVVAEAVASDEFADHFGTRWATLLVGRSPQRRDYHRRLRHWIADEIVIGTPWSEIAGELVAARGSEENPPTNFLLAHLNDQAVPATAITSRVLMGRRIQCVQCHRHPLSGAGQEEFWQLNAFFKQTEIRTVRRNGQLQRELVDRTDGGPVYYEDLSGLMRVAYPAYAGVEASREDGVARRRVLAEQLAGDRTVAEAMASRLWTDLIGAPLAEKADDLGPHAIVSHPAVLDTLTEALVAAEFDVRKLAQVIASTRAYGLSSRLGRENEIDQPIAGHVPLFARAYVKPLTAEQIYDSIVVASQGTSSPDESFPDRETWVGRFYEAQQNEENGDLSRFDAGVNQALALMNGELTAAAVQSDRAAALRQVLDAPGTRTAKLDAVLTLALGRPPRVGERIKLTRALIPAVDRYSQAMPADAAAREGLRDVFWACLNSSSFALNY